MTEDEVIKGSLWQVTVYAAFQRAKVYSRDASDSDKKGIKDLLRKEIDEKLKNYANPVAEDLHMSSISSIANAINKNWSAALLDDEIPIGVVQKAFNLYLKFMWCLKEIPEPPHCPLDKVIIDKLAPTHRKSWTKIRDIETYNILVAELRKLAGSRSLAVWELETYEKP
ncbi:hypothetical protein [Kineobactrum salinum]|uniref:Uncharacterized protein n=1 Tax=Kineobactrum salinum TaxID=2708301 RepID=A0A6C0U8S6_9GAMM|nr:hypothetical protein [Kineobactrum salinum]QIB66955.1 hypothetical protein G3T16_17725 [Kineobactrum salinum]